MGDQLSSRFNNPDDVRKEEYKTYRKAFAEMAEIYEKESATLHPRRLKEAVRRTQAEGMVEFLPGMTRRYPRDMIEYLETGRDPEDEFKIGGAL